MRRRSTTPLIALNIATAKAAHKDAPAGLYTEGDNFRIWVRRWAEVLEENRQRLHFYREHLKYEPEEEAALEDMFGKYLPAAAPAAASGKAAVAPG